MSQQAQIDALEHLLIAVLKKNKMTLQTESIFESAHGSIFGSDGPPGTTEKTAAASYLEHLKLKLS